MNERQDQIPDNERRAAAAGKLLRDSAGELDAATLSRLNRARQAALAAGQPGIRRRPTWLAAAAGATTLAFLVLVVRLVPGPGPESGVPADAGDLDVLLADESLEMMEDLEFYTWLDPELSDAELQAELESAG